MNLNAILIIKTLRIFQFHFYFDVLDIEIKNFILIFIINK